MSKFPAKTLMLTVLVLLLNAGVAFADPSSSDWNDSWGFPTPFEKSNLLNQAIAIELAEEDGFGNNTYYGITNTDVLAIGNQVVIEGDNNEVDAGNNGNVAAQQGSDDINQETENEIEY